MPMELIHTSAPHGIDANARGFTVVAMSQGLGGVWKTRLESLSSYSIETGVAEKPVVCRHVLLRVGGSRRHVLSRISPCGLDYTGRPNRIAHHLLLDPSECPGSGPGWLLQQDDLFCHQWDRDPVILGVAPILPDSNITPSVCSIWKELTGDAGHAGHVLRHLQSEDRKPLVLVLPNGNAIPPLTLFAEAIALLDPADRWTATFTTLVQKLPSDAECAIQIAIAGTQTARTALAHPGMLALDVTSMPACPQDAFTQAAREGTGLPAFNSPRAGLVDPHKKLVDPRKRAADSRQAPRTASQTQGKSTLQQQPVATGPIELIEENVPPAHNRMGRVETPTKQSPLPWILAGVSIVLVVILGAALLITTGDSGIPAATDGQKEMSEASGKTGTDADAENDSESVAGSDGKPDDNDPSPLEGMDDAKTPVATDDQKEEPKASVNPEMGACLFDINKCELLTKSACKEKDGLWDSTCTCADDFPSISVCIQDTGTMGDKKVIVVVKINDPQERMSHEWYADGESQSVGGSLTGGGPDYPFKFDLPGEPSGFTTGQEYGLSVLNKEREVIGFDKKTLRLPLPFKIKFTETDIFDRANWKGRYSDGVVLLHATKVAITPHNVADMSIDVPDYSWAYSGPGSWKASSDGDDLPTLILKQKGKASGNKYKLEIGESDTNIFFTIRVNEKESYTLLSKQQDEKDISRAEDEAKMKREEGQGVDQGGTWNKDGTVCTFNPPPSDEEYELGDPTGSAKAPRSPDSLPDSLWETVGDSDDKWKIEHDDVRWELSREGAREGEYKWKLELMDKNPNHYPDEPIMLIDQHGRRTYELKVPQILPFKIKFTETDIFDRANWKGRYSDGVVLLHATKVAITPHNVADMSIDVPDYSWAYSGPGSWKASSDGDDLPTLILKQKGKASGNKYKLEIGESDTNIFFTIRVNEKESYTLLSKQQDEKDISRAEDEAKMKREEGQGVDQGGTWNKDGTVCTFNPPPSDEEYELGDPTGSAKAPRSPDSLPDSLWETVGDSDDKWKIEHDDVRWELSREGAREGEYKWKLELMDKNPNHYPDEPIMLIDQHGRRTYELKVPPNNKSTEAEETPSSSGKL